MCVERVRRQTVAIMNSAAPRVYGDTARRRCWFVALRLWLREHVRGMHTHHACSVAEEGEHAAEKKPDVE